MKRRKAPAKRFLKKVISGGQTGADRAALDVAIELGIAHGGWVPRGRWAEDGPLPARYQVTPTRSSNYPVRTERNVRDSDATLIFSHGPLAGGSALTLRLANRLKKPVLHIDLSRFSRTAAKTVLAWLRKTRPAVLNVAGSRASTDPQIYDRAITILRHVLPKVSENY